MKSNDDYAREAAMKILSEKEIEKMEHCIGLNKGYRKDKIYHRNGMAYYKPYRNHFSPGGDDIPIWEHLRELEFADCGKPWGMDKRLKTYWLTLQGLSILSVIERVYIYNDAASGNEIDCQHDVLDCLLDHAVYCGYGCWIPPGAKEIARGCRLPYKLTLETLHYLQDKCGYVEKTYEGGCDDEGFPHCNHGWSLTLKWIDENREKYEARQKEEYARIDAMLNTEVEDGVEGEIPFS